MPLVELRSITKHFGEQEVLKSVDLDLRPGEVHVLAGENGAGKSTLIKILAGAYDDYDGWILVSGELRRFHGPQDARRAGIAVIHQELSLIGEMSVADNLFLGREIRSWLGTIATRRQHRAARSMLAEVGLDLDVTRPVASFPIAIRQLVEVARAISSKARVLVMDEPTSALSEPEAARLFDRVRELRRSGCGILYISHRMHEIYELADRITVLRDGIRIGTADTADLSRDRLVRWMVGRDLKQMFPRRRTEVGATVLTVTGLTVRSERHAGKNSVEDLSFALREGEILGIAGLEGSGKSEVLHALFGNRASTADARSPRAAMRRGFALVTNDRTADGIVPVLDVTANTTLAAMRSLSRFGTRDVRAERRAADDAVRRLRLAGATLDSECRDLSGGNQQKVLLARWIVRDSKILLLDEPTRGIDIGAKADIYAWMRRHVDDGGSVLLITSEMEELLGLSDRILVLHRGRLAAEFDRGDATAEAILHAAMGGSVECPN